MSISGLIQTLLFVSVFLIFISGDFGWLLVYTIVIAVVLSFLVSFFSRRHFDISVPEFIGTCESGDECSFEVTFRKKGFCFIPVITAEGELDGQKFAVKACLIFRNSVTLPIKLRVENCGLRQITLSQTVTEDIMGMFRFRRKWDISADVAVLPKRTEYEGPEFVPSVLPSDDEDREEGISVMYGGLAGYEHRPYVDGDPPRKINYKLSAKRRKLLVRLDESNGAENTNIILSDDADSFCAEQAYALAEKLIAGGSPSAVYFRKEKFSVSVPTALIKLREWLAYRRFGVLTGETPHPEGSVNVYISPAGIRVNG